MSYKINLRFRRFSLRTGQLTGLSTYYIGFIDQKAPPSNSNRDHISPIWAKYLDLGPSARTITMDHDAIISFMIDRLAEVQIKMFTPRGVQSKYPSGVDVIYL